MKDRCDDDNCANTAARIRVWLRCVAAGLLAGLVWLAAPPALAQDDPPLPIDPTPLADLLTAPEKAQLAGANNPKKSIEIYVKIAEGRLDSALASANANDVKRAERELDVFQKAMAECVKTASALTDGRRGVAKKVEQALYKQLRTLESVERLFPAERVQFAEAAIKRAKRFRVQMLNIAIASGEVLNDPDAPKPPTTDHRPQEPPSNRPPLLESRRLDSPQRQVAWRASSHRLDGLMMTHPGRPVGQFPNDYLTEEEDEQVRKAQAPDDRIKVFMKIADRRLAALNPPPASTAPTDAKAQKKAEEKAAEEKKDWGELPKLSRADLLRHYARAIEEGMAKLEDSYEHNPKSKALSKALEILREATDRHLQTLRSLTAAEADRRESDALRRAIDQAEVANEGARKGVKAKTT